MQTTATQRRTHVPFRSVRPAVVGSPVRSDFGFGVAWRAIEVPIVHQVVGVEQFVGDEYEVGCVAKFALPVEVHHLERTLEREAALHNDNRMPNAPALAPFGALHVSPSVRPAFMLNRDGVVFAHAVLRGGEHDEDQGDEETYKVVHTCGVSTLGGA